ncbi:hypothetical protein [Nonomuraea bangladeshensis]|uniref:hypothetical protein n=1 Tax=Nonomuraea bangladeshensis TaxID=404385 RepID=UPI0031DFFA10
MAVEIVEDSEVRGLADVFLQAGEADPARVAGSLREHALLEGLAMPAGRSGLDVFFWVAERLRGRTWVEDLGEHVVDVRWLSFHVPPGGDGQLLMRNSGDREYGMSLKILGSGWGSGREVKVSLTDDYGERDHCLDLVLDVAVRARSYVVGDGPPEICTTVLGARRVRLVSLTRCTLCGRPSEEFDPIGYELDDQLGVDLRADQAGARRSKTFELNAEDEYELGFSIGAADAGKVGMTVRRSFQTACEVSYRFPGGWCFTPFRPAYSPADLPFWAVD